MSLASIDVPDCNFHWDIHHPFTPWRLLIAHFYHGSRDLTQWKVMIEPLKRRMNRWSFAFHLKYEYKFDGREEITADRVRIGIYLHNRCITEKDVRNVPFRSRNFFSYSFNVVADSNIQQEQELLVIKVMLDLPGEPAENPFVYGVDDDLKLLSEDLRRLFITKIYSDLTFNTSDGLSIPCHSCILKARCGNFPLKHPLSHDTSVAVRISSKALWDILIYFYSGQVEFGFPRNVNLSYVAELFQMIYQYDLYHLQKVIFKRDMKQRRVSRRNVITNVYTFPLVEMVNSPINTLMVTQCVNQNTPYEFIFRMKVEDNCGPWLSYSLRSRSGIHVYVHVNLDLRKKIVEMGRPDPHTYYQITHLNHRDYAIQPYGFEQSRNVLFLGCPETFSNLTPVVRPDQSIEVCDSIICTLTFTDGVTFDVIQSKEIDNEDKDEMQRLNILGDNLFKLLQETTEADLRILAPTESEKQPVVIRAHHPIIAARVPHWLRVFEDKERHANGPSIVESSLKSRALQFVLQYIYSSKSLSVPHDLLDDIQHFARTGECLSLLNYVMRIRSEHDADWDDSE